MFRVEKYLNFARPPMFFVSLKNNFQDHILYRSLQSVLALSIPLVQSIQMFNFKLLITVACYRWHLKRMDLKTVFGFLCAIIITIIMYTFCTLYTQAHHTMCYRYMLELHFKFESCTLSPPPIPRSTFVTIFTENICFFFSVY